MVELFEFVHAYLLQIAPVRGTAPILRRRSQQAPDPARRVHCAPIASGAIGFPVMAIYRLGDLIPSIHPDAYIHPDAVVIGDVTVGAESTIWPATVLRGDYGSITIGARTSVQDGAVIHAGATFPTLVGDGCVIGHLAHLEGCTVEDESLVGSGSVVLHYAVIGTGATVGANAVIPNRMQVPPGALAVGVPAVIRQGKSSLPTIRYSAAQYVENGKRFKDVLVRLD
jgi:carbonic anhydrase/acetyltransferase-like protein (isoleucine patch superfamily)